MTALQEKNLSGCPVCALLGHKRRDINKRTIPVKCRDCKLGEGTSDSFLCEKCHLEETKCHTCPLCYRVGREAGTMGTCRICFIERMERKINNEYQRDCDG